MACGQRTADSAVLLFRLVCLGSTTYHAYKSFRAICRELHDRFFDSGRILRPDRDRRTLRTGKTKVWNSGISFFPNIRRQLFSARTRHFPGKGFSSLKLHVFYCRLLVPYRQLSLVAPSHVLRGTHSNDSLLILSDVPGESKRGKTVDRRADRNPERFGEFKCVWNRRREVLGHLLALRLVLRIRLVAESRPAWVHGENGMGGFLALKDRLKPGREPKQRRGVDPSRSKTRISEKYKMPFVEKGHHVDYEQLTHLQNSIA